MMRLPALFFTAALVASVSPLSAQGAGSQSTQPSIEDRIRESLSAAESLGDLEGRGLSGYAPALGEDDVSLQAPTSQSRLRTTLDAVDIEQRIDKGLTAAGEQSAFPPDMAFGAYQRGWFLTASSLALERAEKNDPSAQTLLGVLLSRGLGVKQDLAAAADWFRLAGNAGDAEALYSLGQLYFTGQGVKQDFGAAAALFRRAGDKGHAAAAHELGYLLLEGKGIDQNAMLGAAYLRRAAGHGDMDAQFTLGGLYVEGVGVVADDEQAARWFAEAARNGHVGAQVEYAITLFNGRGVKKDEAVAAYWFRQAADADNPAAQLRLARLLSEGRGVDRNPAEAARWYLIAKRRGVEDGFLEEFIRHLDAATLATATEAAEQWTSKQAGWVAAAATPARQGGTVDNSIE